MRFALSRGESLVAWAGLASAAIMVLALGASTLWQMREQREHERHVRKDQTTIIANLLAKNAESMLAAGDAPALRSMLAGLSVQYGLSQVQITLPDHASTVIADSTTQTKFQPIPENWNTLKPAIQETAVTQSARSTEVRVPLSVPGKGPATLLVRSETSDVLFRGWQAQVGAGVIGVASLTCLWLAYRSARARLQGVGAVREALRALSEGERDAAALSVAPSLGAEAIAWNRLVSEAEQLRERLTQDKINDRLGARRGGETELHSVCDALWQGLLLLDDKLTMKYANGAAGVLLGVKREALANIALDALIPEEKVISAIRKVAEGTSRTRTSVEWIRTGEGARVSSVLRFTIRPVRRGDSGAVLVVVDDVTQQKVADDSRNAFVASATHELRTPLTNMRLYVDQLVEDPNLEPAARAQALNVVSGEIRRLERLVGDMLSVAEIEAGQLKLHRDDVRLETVFDELRMDFEQQARQKSITLTFELPPKWPQLVGDRDKIVLAMHNLVGNAIKYTPSGGSVNVRVQADQTTLTVDVVDTGIGIAEAEAELIFDKFYRANDKRISDITGTGLGLAIARDVVRLHGGEIAVHSQIDKGSTFTVSLPIAA